MLNDLKKMILFSLIVFAPKCFVLVVGIILTWSQQDFGNFLESLPWSFLIDVIRFSWICLFGIMCMAALSRCQHTISRLLAIYFFSLLLYVSSFTFLCIIALLGPSMAVAEGALTLEQYRSSIFQDMFNVITRMHIIIVPWTLISYLCLLFLRRIGIDLMIEKGD